MSPGEHPPSDPERRSRTAPEDPATGTPAEASSAEPAANPAHQHASDGLELARQQARAVARARPATGSTPRKKARKSAYSRGRQGVQASGAHPDDRDPQTIEAVVSRLVEDHGWAVDLRVQGIFARWAELVGADVAEHARPEHYADAKLTVRTDSTAWATQLRLLAPSIVRRLNEELGSETVRIVEVRGPEAPSWSRGSRRVKGRGPGDTYG